MALHYARSRRKPLIPEPFPCLTISWQAMLLSSPRFAQRCGKFCPELDIPQYRNRLSTEKQTELIERTNKLHRRAIQNQMFEGSEFNWEADAWSDVFGQIRNDDTFRMLYPSLDSLTVNCILRRPDHFYRDKRPYEFIKKDEHNNLSVSRRVPDATMGLRTYNDSDLENGYKCTVIDCKINHDSMQPSESLLDYRINAQMYDRQRGLTVDGVWGESNLIFPFAVYEAKKCVSTWEQAEHQIYHAFKVYLAMLDDLARDPLDVTKYQSEQSARYQMFGFTSCGSYWRVYIAWNFLDACHVETIWQGDIKTLNGAYELICIVDQIHDFAANEHRKFVIKHLEPWLSHGEECFLALFREFLELYPDRFPETLADPEWLRIKEASKQARNAKRAETRQQNRFKAQDDARNPQSQTLPKKKPTKGSDTTKSKLPGKRGRPPNKVNKPQPKRPRGRPRKCVDLDIDISS